MKKILLAVALLLISSTAHAQVNKLNPNAMQVTPTGSSTTDSLADWLGAFPSGNISLEDDRVVTGTTDTILATDAGVTVVYKNQDGTAVTLPAATATGFGSGYGFTVSSRGAGGYTITSTSTIDNVKSLFVAQGDDCSLRSNGSNYATGQCPVYTYNPTFSTGDITTGDARITAANASTISCTYVDSSGVVKYTTAGNCAGRVTYDPFTLALRGYMIEPAATNYAQYSTEMTNSYWAVTGAVRNTATGVTSPDGTTNVMLLTVPAGAGSVHGIAKSITGSNCQTNKTISVFVKDVPTNSKPYLGVQACASSDCFSADFNLTTMTLTATGVQSGGVFVGAGVEKYQDGWARYYITGRGAASATCFATIAPLSVDGGSFSFSAIGDEKLYLWGGQLEEGTVATSMIPTTATALTRSADVASITTPYWLKNSEGTLCADFITNTNTSGARVFSDATSDLTPLYFATATGAGSKDGTNTVAYAKAFASAGSANKVCTRYGSSVSNVSINGSLGTQQTFDNSFGITGINIFRDNAGANNAYGYLKNIDWYSYQLSDTDINARTAP